MVDVVTDIQAAMELWISKLKVGPRFLLPSFTVLTCNTRGRPSQAEQLRWHSISFAGHSERRSHRQPNNVVPSVYREVLESSGARFITGCCDGEFRAGCGALSRRPDTTWPSSRAFQAAGVLPTWTLRHSLHGFVELIELVARSSWSSTASMAPRSAGTARTPCARSFERIEVRFVGPVRVLFTPCRR